MTSENTQRAKLTTIASFPRQYFLENMPIRGDNSILVTVANHQELWYIPPPSERMPLDPLLLCTFAQSAMGIVEREPNLFYICPSNSWTSHQPYLLRLHMRPLSP